MTTRDPRCCRRVFEFRKHVLPGGAWGWLLGTFASISGVLAIAAVLNLAWQRIRGRAARHHQMAGQAA